MVDPAEQQKSSANDGNAGKREAQRKFEWERRGGLSDLHGIRRKHAPEDPLHVTANGLHIRRNDGNPLVAIVSEELTEPCCASIDFVIAVLRENDTTLGVVDGLVQREHDAAYAFE